MTNSIETFAITLPSPTCADCGRAIADPFGWCGTCRRTYCFPCGRRHYCRPSCPSSGCLAGLCVRVVANGQLSDRWGIPDDA